jgi:autotransporter translocation and assembly factor TamB
VSSSPSTLVRVLVGFIRLFPIAVAVGGIWHLVLLTGQLAQPLYNLRVVYQGESERGVLWVGQARLDFSRATLHARNISLRDVRGREIASAQEVFARLGFPWGDRPATVVSLRGGTIDLVRLENGTWELARFLPKRPEEEPSESPFEVRAEGVRFRVIDRATPGAPVWTGVVRTVTASGYGDNTFGRGVIEVDGVGLVTGLTEITDGKLASIEITTESAELSELLAYAQAMPDLQDISALRDIRAASANFSGNLSVWTTPEVRWRVGGRLEGRGVSYNSYAASDVRFQGIANWVGMSGEFGVQASGATANGQLMLNWKDGSVLARGEARISNADALRPFGIEIPEGVAFSKAVWSGTVGWRDALAFDGVLRAEAARMEGIGASDVQARVTSNGKALRITNASATLAGGTAQAELLVSLNDQQIQGYAQLSDIELAGLPKVPPEVARYVVEGQADVALAVSGTLSDPFLQVRADGVAEVIAPGETYVVVDHPAFSLSGSYQGGRLLIEDARASAKSGSLFISGAVQLDEKTLDLAVRGDALDLLLYPDSPVSGTAFMNLRVNGSFDNPRIAGPVEAFGVEAAGIVVPIARFDAEYIGGGSLDLKNIVLRQGPSEATGSLRLIETSRGWTIEGEGAFNHVTLDSFIAADVAGIATGAWSVSGLIEDPEVKAHLEADTLFLGDLSVENVRAEARWFGRTAHLERFTARFGAGVVTASGAYALDGESSIQVRGESLDLSALSHFLSDSVAFAGSAGLTGEVTFVDGAIARAVASAELSGVAMNAEPVGAGAIQAQYESGRLSVSGSVGSLEGYFILDDSWYDFNTADYAVSINLLNVPSESLYNLTKRYLPTMEPETADLLQSTRGWLTTSLYASGNAANADEGDAPVAERVRDASATFELSGIEARGEPLGTLHGKVSKEGLVWKILDFSWTGGPIEARLLPSSTNTITEGGDMAVEVEFLNADLSALNRLFPGLTPLSGRGDLTLVFSGSTASPQGWASLSVDGMKIGDSPPIDITVAGISINNSAIEVRAGEGTGLANLRSFAARLAEARIPFRYPFEFPDEPIYIRVVVPGRDINAVSEFFGGLNTDITIGRIHEGEVVITGTLGQPEVHGAIRASAERLALQGLDQVLHGVSASLTLDGTLTNLSVAAFDDAGGALRFEGGVNLETLELLPTSLTADTFRIRQEIGERNILSGVLAGEITASGSWREPSISGTLTTREALLALRGAFPERASAAPLPINPSLNVSLLAERSEFRSGPLDAVLVGSGSLTGTLEEPRVRAEFRVLGGTLRLPTTDLRFTEGSRAVFTYAPQGAFEDAPKLDVALNATTRITAHNGISVQRYTVNLSITGDVLSDQELSIIASSDPPDLSREQIVAILGQQQLLEGVAGAAVGGFNAQLADTLAAVLAPVLARSVTRSIERSLGLDYLSFDIRPGTATSVTLAKALGSGFTLEYRRTLEEFEESGVPLEEVGLTYSPRVRNPILGRTRISLIAERGGVLRISIGYSRRF